MIRHCKNSISRDAALKIGHNHTVSGQINPRWIVGRKFRRGHAFDRSANTEQSRNRSRSTRLSTSRTRRRIKAHAKPRTASRECRYVIPDCYVNMAARLRARFDATSLPDFLPLLSSCCAINFYLFIYYLLFYYRVLFFFFFLLSLPLDTSIAMQFISFNRDKFRIFSWFFDVSGISFFFLELLHFERE